MQKVKRLIFGLKLKQLRLKNKFSLNDLQEQTGLSKSYLNEIEKGKKFPKKDKIILLAKALNSSFDSLISFKIDENLGSLEKYFQPKIFSKIPFKFLDIDPANVLAFLSKEPLKLNVFLEGILKINDSNNISQKEWYEAILSSYIEITNNNFEDLELLVRQIKTKEKINSNTPIDEQLLGNILRKNYGLNYKFFNDFKSPSLRNISVVKKPEHNYLMLNKNLREQDKIYHLAKEIGFQIFNSKYRSNTQPLLDTASFNEYESDFMSSNFANIFLINKAELSNVLKTFFAKTKIDLEFIPTFLKEKKITAQSLFNRIATIISEKNHSVFYVEFEVSNTNKLYFLNKEFNLSKSARSFREKSENYCRRWMPISILENFDLSKSKQIFNYQIAHFTKSRKDFLILSICQPLNEESEINRSVSVGIEINEEIKKEINFLSGIKSVKLNETCQKCEIFDCQDRVAAPIILQRQALNEDIKKAVEKLK